MKANTGIFILACALTMAGATAFAKEQVYGWQLMTEQERAEHRAKMQSFTTNEERERYRMEHHKMMQQRAKERGVNLPDEPLQRGRAMGGGPGDGMGAGGGQGKSR